MRDSQRCIFAIFFGHISHSQRETYEDGTLSRLSKLRSTPGLSFDLPDFPRFRTLWLELSLSGIPLTESPSSPSFGNPMSKGCSSGTPARSTSSARSSLLSSDAV